MVRLRVLVYNNSINYYLLSNNIRYLKSEFGITKSLNIYSSITSIALISVLFRLSSSKRKQEYSFSL
ncbi:hypothetical protein Glove_688g19 [Diversispora epigaea]|uniref:Uncharacterized protein n=1 Tax=Diversispora epigaea TaxID=1348612 RepID=A0A397G5S2_9GLOM|nr:hypothetical protein Glove_688g19 [Diversispora epigaea]